MDINEWLLAQITDLPVLANKIARKAALRGWGEQELREAFDATKLSYVKRSGGTCAVYWHRPMTVSHWIWCKFRPLVPLHRQWCLDLLETKEYKRHEYFHWLRCPPPNYFIERREVIEWTEPSSFARRQQNAWIGTGARLTLEEGRDIVEQIVGEIDGRPEGTIQDGETDPWL